MCTTPTMMLFHTPCTPAEYNQGLIYSIKTLMHKKFEEIGMECAYASLTTKLGTSHKFFRCMNQQNQRMRSSNKANSMKWKNTDEIDCEMHTSI